MPEGNSIQILIHNKDAHIIYINGQAVAPGVRCYFEIPDGSIQASNTDDNIQITFDGVEINSIIPEQGMCFCLAQGSSVSLTFTESMYVTIKPGIYTIDDDDGLPAGVRCGE